jgi:hypothetical protein
VEPRRQPGVTEPVRGVNWTTIALIGGLVLLVLLVAYFAKSRNSDQDKLTNAATASETASGDEKTCASKATYDLIKRDLFRRAAQVRGSDQGAYDRLAAYSVLRMENPVMESEDSANGAVNCSGSLSLDLPPGVAVVGGRRTLNAEVDYTVQPAADGSGNVVLLRNADPIVTPLATLARVAEAAPQPTMPESNEAAPADPLAPIPAPTPAAPARPAQANPSFNCGDARTNGERAVCGDSGLSALDRNMAAQFGRAVSSASPDQRAVLQETRDRFLRYRDRCHNRQCIADAYVGRMREIRDIMEGGWQPPR